MISKLVTMSCYMSVVTFARAFSLKCFKLLNAMPCPDQIKRKRCICTYVSRLHLSPWPPSIARSNEKRLIFKAGIGMTCRLSCIVHHACDMMQLLLSAKVTITFSKERRSIYEIWTFIYLTHFLDFDRECQLSWS